MVVLNDVTEELVSLNAYLMVEIARIGPSLRFLSKFSIIRQGLSPVLGAEEVV